MACAAPMRWAEMGYATWTMCSILIAGLQCNWCLPGTRLIESASNLTNKTTGKRSAVMQINYVTLIQILVPVLAFDHQHNTPPIYILSVIHSACMKWDWGSRARSQSVIPRYLICNCLVECRRILVSGNLFNSAYHILNAIKNVPRIKRHRVGIRWASFAPPLLFPAVFTSRPSNGYADNLSLSVQIN